MFWARPLHEIYPRPRPSAATGACPICPPGVMLLMIEILHDLLYQKPLEFWYYTGNIYGVTQALYQWYLGVTHSQYAEVYLKHMTTRKRRPQDVGIIEPPTVVPGSSLEIVASGSCFSRTRFCFLVLSSLACASLHEVELSTFSTTPATSSTPWNQTPKKYTEVCERQQVQNAHSDTQNVPQLARVGDVLRRSQGPKVKVEAFIGWSQSESRR